VHTKTKSQGAPRKPEIENRCRDPWYHVTAVKGFEVSKNRDKQRNIQYLFYKSFAIKVNTLENCFEKGYKEINLAP
jgi:hypothetical protein